VLLHSYDKVLLHHDDESNANVDVTPEELKQVEDGLRAEGFKPFEVELGGRGVGVLGGVTLEQCQEFTHRIEGVVSDDVRWLHWS